MFSQDRDSMRLVILDTWRKAREGKPLEPLERQIVQVVEGHPEYHRLLENPQAAVSREFSPEDGQTNPFLHLGLHLAVLEQVASDRPPGIRALHQRVAASADTAHDAEHQIMECLAQGLWDAQRQGRPPDERDYLACIERLAPASGKGLRRR